MHTQTHTQTQTQACRHVHTHAGTCTHMFTYMITHTHFPSMFSLCLQGRPRDRQVKRQTGLRDRLGETDRWREGQVRETEK